MVLQFYYDPHSPPSKAIWMILEHSGIPYEKNKVALMEEANKKEEYLKINPFGQVPAIVDGDLNLTESRAIATYLIQKHGAKCGGLYPSGDITKKFLVDRVLFTDASIYDGKIFSYLNFDAVFGGKQGLAVDKLESLKTGLKKYDHFLSKNRFMAGDEITVADFTCLNSMLLLTYGDYRVWDEFTNVKRWYEEEMKVLPCYKTCVEDVEADNQFKPHYQGMLAEYKKKAGGS